MSGVEAEGIGHPPGVLETELVEGPRETPSRPSLARMLMPNLGLYAAFAAMILAMCGYGGLAAFLGGIAASCVVSTFSIAVSEWKSDRAALSGRGEARGAQVIRQVDFPPGFMPPSASALPATVAEPDKDWRAELRARQFVRARRRTETKEPTS